MADFIPASDAELSLWLVNFKQKLPTYSTLYAFPPGELEQVTTKGDAIIAAINTVEISKAKLKTDVSNKDALKNDGITHIRKFVNRIKAHGTFTDAHGQDLGILYNASSAKLDELKPVIKAQSFPGYVRISFTKKGLSGVNIYARLEGETKWGFLGRDTNSPYDDHRPLANGQAESREYMAIGLDGDDEVTQQSDIVSVVFGG